MINDPSHIHNLVICSNVIVRKDGTYLLLKRSLNKKYLPGVIMPLGGRVDKNENPYQAAERELFEEAGIHVKNMKLEAVVLEIKPCVDEDENWLIFHFSADYQSGELRPSEEGEFVFLTKEEVLQAECFTSLKKALPHILEPHDGTVFLTCQYDSEGKYKETSALNVCAV